MSANSSVYSLDETVFTYKPTELDSLTVQLANNLIPQENRSLQSLFETLPDIKKWLEDIFKVCAIYYNNDKLLWGPFIVIISKDLETNNICAIILDKLGVTVSADIDITKDSQFYPAIENLNSADQQSNVKKSIAVALLKKFSRLSPSHVKLLQNAKYDYDYDHIYAGELASNCQIFHSFSPELLKERILETGFFSNRMVNSLLLDVVYENNEKHIDSNNKLVFHLGEQLEQLFNPISEYSPEQTEYIYKPPENDTEILEEDELIRAIINELLKFQSNFTFDLVEFLQKVLITLRVRVLNDEIDRLSTVKLNRLFPPTIDEVTRINCIFLDSLKSAVPFGSLEVLKACSLTIPYFYKAYTRHEAATKNFNKDIKLFLRNFQDILPEKDTYTEFKLETIMKGPQEKLIKLKLIIDRLWNKKQGKWLSLEQENIAKAAYNNIIDVVDSFGNLDRPMSSYNTRVFTPSGKILTELAKGWPVELQYKWLKRRVVGVFDIIDLMKKDQRSILVIFSDYIVFLSITDSEKYYTSEIPNKPLISDILMNSLINEIPLPTKIPKLIVENYCYVDKVLVSVFDNNSLRFDALKGEKSFSVSCKLATSSAPSVAYVADLITKAKILEKDTAFHLFKALYPASSDTTELTLYSTAHEKDAYGNEKIKSPFALFLNIKPDKKILLENKLQVAIFAKIINGNGSNELIQFDVVSANKRPTVIKLSSNLIVENIIKILSEQITRHYSSISSLFNHDLMKSNLYLLKEIHRNNGDALRGYQPTTAKPISEQVNAVNRQSYGTITTFRSHESDLKSSTADVEPEVIEVPDKSPIKPIARLSKENETKTDVKVKTPRKSKAIKKAEKQSRTAPKTNKGKKSGFIETLKNIFSSKNKSASSNTTTQEQTQKTASKTSTTNISKPITNRTSRSHKILENNRLSKIIQTPINEKGTAKITKKDKINEKSLGTPTEKTESKPNNDDDTDEQLRISSVVHNTAYGTPALKTKVQNVEKKNASKTANEKSTKTTDSAVTKLHTVQDNKLKNDAKQNATTLEVINNEDSSFIEQSEMSHSTIETMDIVNKRLARKIKALGQVFDNDLFGDFVESIPDPKKRHHRKRSKMTRTIDDKQTSRKINSTTDSSVGNKQNEIMEKNMNEAENAETVTEKTGEGMQNKENEKPKDTIEKETEVIDLSEENSTDEKISIESESSLVEDSTIKPVIFPKIPPMNPRRPRVQFEKSPSFIQLFQGMRIVLDEHDAHYNWRKLPSTTSLREDSLIDPQEGSKEFASNNKSEPMDLILEEKEHSKIDDDMNSSTKNDDSAIIDHTVQIDPPHINVHDSMTSETSNVIESEVNEVVQSMFQDTLEESSIPDPGNKSSRNSGNFKIINTSPIKFVDKSSFTNDNSVPSSAEKTTNRTINFESPIAKIQQSSTVENVDSNMVSDYSFSSPTAFSKPDKRWLELSFATNDATSQLNVSPIRSSDKEGGDEKKSDDDDDDASEVADFEDHRNFSTPLEHPSEQFLVSNEMNETTRETEDVNGTVGEEAIQERSQGTIEIDGKSNDIKEPIVDLSDYTPESHNDTTILHDIRNPKKDTQNISNDNSRTLKSDNKNQDHNVSLLEDIDFSSFNMTFDMDLQDNDDSKNRGPVLSQIFETQENSNIWNDKPNLTHSKNPPPPLYKLSNDLSSSKKETKSTNNDVDDEPFWVSPSKLEFDDTNNKSSPLKGSATTKKAPNNMDDSLLNIVHDELNNMNGVDSNEDDGILGDTSFTFLANIVDSDNVNYDNDKPEKLKFVS